MNSYYEILGVSRTASKDEIKSAYIKALKKFHPDVYTGSEKFAQDTTAKLNEIYEVLKDDEKRKAYDYSLISQSQQTYAMPQQSTTTSAKTNDKKAEKNENSIFSDIKNIFKINLKNSTAKNNQTTEKNNNKKIKKEKINNKKQKILKKSESLSNKDKEKKEDAKLNMAIYIILGIIAALFLIILIF